MSVLSAAGSSYYSAPPGPVPRQGLPAIITAPGAALLAVGDGVADDTTKIQAAMNIGGAAFTATGRISDVVLPSGFSFLTNQLIAVSGVRLCMYGATIIPSPSWGNHGLIYYPNNSTIPILSYFEMRGGHVIGSGTEDTTTNQMVFQAGTNTGVQDFLVRDMLITNWGATSLYPRNATRAKVLDNTIICNGINNNGFQNEISFDYDGGAAASGKILVARNFIHNATADSIASVVLASGPANLALHFTVCDNIITADPPIADAGCGFTNGSFVVTDANASLAQVNRFVTASITGLASPVFIVSAVPGVSYTLSKSFTGVTGPGTLYVGVYKNSIKMEVDGANNVTYVDFHDNDVTGYERELIGFSGANGGTTLAKAHHNILTNGQLNAQYGTGSVPQGTGIQLHFNAGVTNDIELTNNEISLASAVPAISRFAVNLTNNGKVSGNKFTTGPAQGQATLVAGTVTVLTTEIQAGDNVNLNVLTPGGTRGMLQLGAITPGVSFVINSVQPGTVSTIQAGDTSVAGWEIIH